MNTEGIFSLSLASITFAMTVIWGGPLLVILRRLRVGKRIRVDGPQTHFSKMGTPTMGGLLVIAPVLVITVTSLGYHIEHLRRKGAEDEVHFVPRRLSLKRQLYSASGGTAGVSWSRTCPRWYATDVEISS